MKLLPSLLALGAVILPQFATANVAVIYNGPNSQSTTVSGASTYTFDSFAAGHTYTNQTWTGIGSFDQFYVEGPNEFGGTNNTNYGDVGSVSGLSSTTLTFFKPVVYFGFEWLAVDPKNEFDVTFYNGSTQVKTLDSTNLALALGTCPGSAYCGNPNDRSKDPNELFAYVNFVATDGSSIDKVVFSNKNSSTGFEYDSLAAVAAPEPATWGGMALGLVSLGLFLRKQRS